MDDQDVLFTFDDEPDDEDITTEEGQNRAFLIGAIALAGVFLLGICLIVYLVVIRPNQAQPDDSIRLTNEANMTFAAETSTAAVEAQAVETEAPEVAEEESPEPEEVVPTETPTSSIEEAEATEEPTEEGGTEVAEVGETPTPLGEAEETSTVEPTSSIIQVTPLGGGGATPTRISGGEEEATVSPDTPSVGGVGGPITPTLPTTGLLDSGPGLAGVGLMAMALVAVAFVVRRIRLNNNDH